MSQKESKGYSLFNLKQYFLYKHPETPTVAHTGNAAMSCKRDSLEGERKGEREGEREGEMPGPRETGLLP